MATKSIRATEITTATGEKVKLDETAPAALTVEQSPDQAKNERDAWMNRVNAITNTVDRTALDHADTELAKASTWVHEAEAAKVEAEKHYVEALEGSFSTSDALFESLIPLGQEFERRVREVTVAQGHSEALRKKSNAERERYSAAVRDAVLKERERSIGEIVVQARELNKWFVDQVISAYRLTKGYSGQPGPTALVEYANRHRGLWAKASVLEAHVPELATMLTPEVVIRTARFDGTINVLEFQQ